MGQNDPGLLGKDVKCISGDWWLPLNLQKPVKTQGMTSPAYLVVLTELREPTQSTLSPCVLSITPGTVCILVFSAACHDHAGNGS